MPLRLISLVAAALALFLTPIAMAGGAAMAAAHGAAAETSAHAAHCGGDEAPQGDKAPDRMIGCSSACSALPGIEPLFQPAGSVPDSGKIHQARHRILIGVPPEGETPPPRITPEI